MPETNPERPVWHGSPGWSELVASANEDAGPSITVPVTLRADALILPIASASVQCVVTSPPYLAQRVYGDNDLEVGQEETVHLFCEQMVGFCEEVRRVMKPNGIFWLNLGDKANGSGGAGGDFNPGGSKAETHRRFGSFFDRKYQKGQFLDVPGKVVSRLQDRDWRLRQYIIWDKGQESREALGHVKRPRTSHEVIFMLQPGAGAPKFFPESLPETGSVWHFAPAQREKKSHQAPFPDELARRCILASTDPGDVVVDPFSGSGTTARVASELGRRGVGVDLYAGEA